jgi:hypothetical protein
VKITRRTEHRVRMGEFESVVISAEVEVDNSALNATASMDRDRATIHHANELIEAALEDDIKELREIADRDSYIREWRNQ